MHLRLLPAVAALALLAVPPARAQDAAAPPASQGADAAAPRAPGEWVEVRLKAGPTFRGALAGEDARSVRIRSLAGAVRTIPRASISQIVPIDAPPAPPSPPGTRSPPASPSPTTEPEAPAPPPPADRRPDAPSAPATGDEGGDRMIGLGVNLRELDLAAGTTTLYLPIQLGESSRVELELGLASSLGGGDDLVARLGLGVFATRMAAPQLRAYTGGRASVSRVELFGTDSTLFRLAAAIGAEWVPVQRVALGVEGQAVLAFGTGNADDAAFGTAALAFLRVFLW